MLTLKDLRKPSNKSGYKYVVPCGNGAGYQASRNGGARLDGWRGPMRKTAKEAAMDYLRYVNGKNPLPKVHVRTKSTGRPDFYKDANGILHVDLPPALTKTPAKKAATKKSSERSFMERIQPTVDKLLKPHDIAEAKAGVSRQQIATAVGQLRLKRFQEGKGRMFIVLPTKPTSDLCKWLRSEKITLITETPA